ncbi:hypothetical protein PR202_gb20538 [Eleusine coracana subsp. coracana]|uniref:Uncharacterized protein n=1 Tax=Eleusine coracana subsp. coracana TaxID=191504 RepID=A0AAV5FCH7_ELECO|nr:hypothetical protein PR202_gb20538 [Eleusine coracana subsp. coracana]
MASRLDTRTFKDEVASMDKRCLLDLGHPLLNRVADSFIRAAGVGAARAVTREAYFVTVDGLSGDSSSGLDPNVPKRSHFSSIRGLAAGVHSGITYGLREARGCHDWKNSAIAGAIAGVAVALTGDAGGHSDKIVHFAITGAALSSAASLLSGVF